MFNEAIQKQLVEFGARVQGTLREQEARAREAEEDLRRGVAMLGDRVTHIELRRIRGGGAASSTASSDEMADAERGQLRGQLQRLPPSSEGGRSSARPPSAASARSSLSAHSSRSSGAGSTGKLPKEFVASTITRVQESGGGLAVKDIATFAAEFREAVLDRSRAAYTYLTMNDERWEEACAAGEVDDNLDAWTATQLVNCFKMSSLRVANIKRRIRDECPEVRTSGRRMLRFIEATVTEGDYGEAGMKRVADYNETSFFEMTSDTDKNEHAAAELLTSFRAQPADVRSSRNAELRALIRKLPAALATEAKDLERKLLKKEALGKPVPWSYNELSILAAQYIAFEVRHNGGGGGGGGGTIAAGEEASAGERPPSKPTADKCFNCNKPGHSADECRKVCAKCSIKGCPGGRGETCVVEKKDFPSKVKNFSPRGCVPDRVYRALKEAHEAKHGGGGSGGGSGGGGGDAGKGRGAPAGGKEAGTGDASVDDREPTSGWSISTWNTIDGGREASSSEAELAAPAALTLYAPHAPTPQPRPLEQREPRVAPQTRRPLYPLIAPPPPEPREALEAEALQADEPRPLGREGARPYWPLAMWGELEAHKDEPWYCVPVPVAAPSMPPLVSPPESVSSDDEQDAQERRRTGVSSSAQFSSVQFSPEQSAGADSVQFSSVRPSGGSSRGSPLKGKANAKATPGTAQQGPEPKRSAPEDAPPNNGRRLCRCGAGCRRAALNGSLYCVGCGARVCHCVCEFTNQGCCASGFYAPPISESEYFCDRLEAAPLEVDDGLYEYECSQSIEAGGVLEFMLDSGANCHLLRADEALVKHALVRSCEARTVRGLWTSGEPIVQHANVAIKFDGLEGRAFGIEGGLAPSARRLILSTSTMWDTHGWSVRTEPEMKVTLRNSTRTIPIYRRNGLYFVRGSAVAAGATAESAMADLEWREVAAAVHRAKPGTVDYARLWGARMGVDGDGLRAVARSTGGSGLGVVNDAMHEAVQRDVIRVRSNQRRLPVDNESPVDSRSDTPGERLIVDAFGPVAAPSVVDGSHYEIEGSCECSSFGYSATSVGIDQEAMYQFCAFCIASEKALGHQVKYVRIDRVPNLSMPVMGRSKFSKRIEADFGVVVEISPRHEGVGGAEQKNDTKQRMAEAMLMRAEKGQNYLLAARVYSNFLLNLRPCRRRSLTRAEHHGAPRPDLSRLTPHLFGSTISCLVDEVARAPKGAGCAPDAIKPGRTALGCLLGIDGASYIVRMAGSGVTVRRRNVAVLDEHVLARRGLPDGTPGVDGETQTSPSLMRETAAPREAPKPAARVHPQRACDRGLVGATIDVLWPSYGGYFRCVVRAVETYPSSGRQRHRCVYDNPGGKWAPEDVDRWHELDKVTWRVAAATAAPTDAGGSATAAAPTATAPASAAGGPAPDPLSSSSSRGSPLKGKANAKATPGTAQPGPEPKRSLPPRRSSRLAQTAAPASALVAECLERASGGELAATFDAAVFQFAPEASDFCHAGHDSEVGAMIGKLERCERAAAKANHEVCVYFEANKATSDVIRVRTDAGMQDMRVPANVAQRDSAPDAEQWKAADGKALDVILNAHPGNRLVPEKEARATTHPLLPMVVQRKLKVDPATDRLEDRNGRKSRACVDGPRADMQRKKAGVSVERSAHAEVGGDMEIKGLVANHASRHSSRVGKGKKGRVMLKIDIGNAYCKARRREVFYYLLLPKALERYDDQGERQCVEMHCNLYGDTWAGDDWDEELIAALTEMGWPVSEGVPTLHYMLPSAAPGQQCNMVRVVDDLLLDMPEEAIAVGEATIKALEAKFGEVSFEWRPTSFAGYTIRYNDDHTVTLHMARHVEQAVAQFLPGIIDGTDRPSRRIPKGSTLQSLSDGLALEETPDEDRRALIQRIAGVVRYPERVTPHVTLPLHRLSCVAASPPAEAVLVAELTLELLWDARQVGLTYGGAEATSRMASQMHAHVDLDGRPPDELEAYADATWGAGIQPESEDNVLPPLNELCRRDDGGRVLATRDLYSMLLTFCGAAIYHATKKLTCLSDSSLGNEEHATSLVAEVTERARTVAQALGCPQKEPTVICSDNEAHVRVAMRRGAAARSRHLLRRYYVLRARIENGVCAVVHVPDAENPSDFLTKWVPIKKLNRSLAYVTGSVRRAEPGRK